MKRSIIALSVLVFLSGFVYAAEIDNGQVNSSAKWVAHFDNELWRNSVGFDLLAEVLENKGLTEKIQGHLAKAVETLGFHPVEDIKDVTLYNDGYAKSEGVMLLEGKFNKEKLLTLLDNDPAHQEHKHGNAIIHQWYDKHKEKDSFGSIVSEELIVIGSSLTKVQKALDVLADKSLSLGVDNGASLPEGTIFSASITGISTIAGDHPKAATLKLIESINLAIGETGTPDDKKTFVNATLNVNSPETANQVKDIVNGMLAFVKLRQQERPILVDLAQSVIVIVDKNKVIISFEYPVEDIFEIMKYMHEMKHDKMAKCNAP